MKSESNEVNPRPAHQWRRIALGVSLVLNLVLLYLIRFPTKPPVADPADRPGARVVPAAAVGGGPNDFGDPSTQNPSTVTGRSTPWSQLVSNDLLEFAARLRAVGCPDQTVCDILTPQIREATRHRKLEAESAADYWAVGAERRRLKAESDESIRRVVQEEEGLIQSLGCSDSIGGMRSALRADWFRREWILLGFIEASRLAVVTESFSHEAAWVSEMKSKTGGILLPEERAELLARRSRFTEELGQHVSPRDQEEMKLRAWVLMQGSEREASLVDLGLTGPEYREYCRLVVDGLPDLVDEATDYDGLLRLPELREDPRRQHQALRELFGDERYRRYRQCEDSGFAAVQELARESGQDPDLAQPAFDVVDHLRNELIPEVRRRWVEDPVAGVMQLRELRDQFHQEVRQLLGGLPEDRLNGLVKDWLNAAIREGWSPP